MVDLGNDGFDFDYDLSRNQIYVSIPNQNELVYVSSRTASISGRHFVGSRPFGVDYGVHSDNVFVALNQAGAVAQVTPDNQGVNEIIVGGSNGTDNPLTYDVTEAASGLVFATASPGSGGFARVARIDLNNGNAISQAANGRIIRANPILLGSPDEQFLYVGEGFSPNSLYKLDITDPAAPLILEDDHGTISGTYAMDINPDGSRIFLASGQVLRSDTFLQAGLIGSGMPRISSDGELAYVYRNGNLETYSTTTFLLQDTFELPSEFANGVQQFALLPNNRGMVMLSGSKLLITSNIPEPTTAFVLSLFSLASLCIRRKR